MSHPRTSGRRPASATNRVRAPLRRRAPVGLSAGLERLEERTLLSVGLSEFSVADAASLLHITSGPDGNLWYTSSGNNQVGVIDTSGKFVTDFGSPSGVAKFPAGSDPEGITKGPDGNLWVCLHGANEILRLTPLGVMSDFATTAAPTEITTGPDGKIWFTEGDSKIGMIDPLNPGTPQDFTVKTPGSQPTDITEGRDGGVWFTESVGNKIGRIDPATGIPQEYAVPTANSQPAGITAGPDGDLWFTECLGNKIGRINPATGVISPTNDEFAVPTANSVPRRITQGPDGTLWFTEQAGQALGQITTSGAITEYPGVPGLPNGITVGPDTNIWFAEDLAVGRAALPGSDLSVTMSDSTTEVPPKPVAVGTNFAITIPVTNNGPDPATNVTLTTTLPPEFQLVPDLSQGSTIVNGQVVTQVGFPANPSDPNDPTRVLQPRLTEFVTLIVMPTKAGKFTTTTEVNSESIQKPDVNQRASLTTTVLAGVPDLAVSMQATPSGTAHVGDDVTYSISVTNNGTDTANDVTLSDTLPSSLQFVSTDHGAGASNISLGSLAPKSTVTVTIVALTTAPGTVTNTATAATSSPDANTDDNTATLSTTIVEPSDLVVSVKASADTVHVGDDLTYTITVTNHGPGQATGVSLGERLPSGIQFISSDATFNGGVADLGTMASGATTTVTVAAKAVTAGTFVDNVSVTSSPDSSHALTSVPTTVLPNGSDLAATMLANPSSPYVGQSVTFTISVTNHGPEIAQGVLLKDTLPAGLQYLSADPALTKDGSFGTTFTGGRVVARLGSMNLNETLRVRIVAQVTQPGKITNQAIVSATSPEDDPSNDNPSYSFTAGYQPVSLSLDGRVATNPVPQITFDTFTWTVSNTTSPGSLPATGLTATVKLPSGFNFSSASIGSGSWTFKPSSQLVTFTLNNLAPGGSTTLSVTGLSLNTGLIALTATVNSRNPIIGGGPLVNTIQALGSSTQQGKNHLDYLGGPVLKNVSVDTIFVGSQWNSKATTYSGTTYDLLSMQADLNQFLAKITNSPYMDFLSQYSSTKPNQTIGRGTWNDGRVILNTPSKVMTDTAIQSIVANEAVKIVKHKVVPGELPNSPNRLYFVFLPPGTEVTTTWGGTIKVPDNSERNFRGYHFSTTLDGKRVFYVVMPFPAGPNNYSITGSSPSTYSASLAMKNLTQVASHELAEAVTDPSVGSKGWVDTSTKDKQEIGDLSANQALKTEPEGGSGDYGVLDGYTVQYEWANKYTYPGTNLTVINDNALPSEAVNPDGTPAVGLAFSRIITPTSSSSKTASVFVSGAPVHADAISAQAASFSFSGPIATFTDGEHPGTDPSIYQVNIDWGDGSDSAGSVTYDPNLNQFIVSGSHTFAQGAGALADITVQLTNTANDQVAGLERVVTLQAATAPPAQLGFDQATYTTGRNGSQAAITVTRTGDTSLESAVDYHLEGGTAVAGVDYMPVAGTLLFEPGQTSQTFTIPIYADPAVTTDQTLNLVLSLPTGNAELGSQSSAVLTIHPSDAIFAPPAPTLDQAADSGTSGSDRVTSNNGSAGAPLTFDVHGASIPNGFVQLFDVTDPSHPVAVGTAVQASHGNATITLSDKALSDGVHQFAVAVSATSGSTLSPLSTPLTVTIDRAAPSSTVKALPAVTGKPDVSVSWSGSDNTGGSGIASYDVLVSDNGGALAPWLQGTTATSAVFHGQNGHHYTFASVATDAAGNVQKAVTSGQAGTSVEVPTLRIAGAGSVASGANYTLALSASGPGAETISRWAINWGDGQIQQVTGSPSSVTHVYALAPTEHTISAVAWDASGLVVASDTVRVSVTANVPQGGPTAFVTTFYRETLGRAPEPSGLHYWVGKLGAGTPDVRVARSIFRSSERRTLVRQHQAPSTPFEVALADARRAAQRNVAPGTSHPQGAAHAFRP